MKRHNPVSEQRAEMLVEAATQMFYLASKDIEAGDLVSALATLQATVINNVIVPHQRMMAVDDIAEATRKVVVTTKAERQKMH